MTPVTERYLKMNLASQKRSYQIYTVVWNQCCREIPATQKLFWCVSRFCHTGVFSCQYFPERGRSQIGHFPNITEPDCAIRVGIYHFPGFEIHPVPLDKSTTSLHQIGQSCISSDAGNVCIQRCMFCCALSSSHKDIQMGLISLLLRFLYQTIPLFVCFQ